MRAPDKTARQVALLTILICAVMSLLDITFTLFLPESSLSSPYLFRSVIKAALFLACPLVWAAAAKNRRVARCLVPSARGFFTALGTGVAVFVVILGAYFLLGGLFDLSGITGSLAGVAGVNQDNFIFVALYISFINSFLEEFFFRGFAFLTLLKSSQRLPAYIFSALVFSLYHVSIMIGWFGLPLYLLILASLFFGGLIFNYFTERAGNIYFSWMIHMFANFAINCIGFILFSAA
ncbi:MAG TPA: CPBP family intramembrane metalloprotease [Clostridiales bacterium]|jgi:membrane protease YdiL (CAAX protease family)|nr:CPBP family intramembrane metalloprotease [Clostridiales bacterium]